MKKIFDSCFHPFIIMVATILLMRFDCSAQTSENISFKRHLGFRIGANYAKVNQGADAVKYSYKPGLMIAAFFSPPTTGVIGYRTEILYSKQGFKYSDGNGVSGTVSNDYLILPQLMTINITKFFQLQVGAFAGYLLHSKDSNEPSGNNNESEEQQVMDMMNRMDYGAAGGIEIHPFKGLILNARYNAGFARLYKKQDDVNQGGNNSLLPYSNINTKNAVIQLSVGYLF